MDDLTDFIENGLYDPAFVHFDPELTDEDVQAERRRTSSTRSTVRISRRSAPSTAGQPAACRRTTTMPCRDVTPDSSSWTSPTR